MAEKKIETKKIETKKIDVDSLVWGLQPIRELLSMHADEKSGSVSRSIDKVWIAEGLKSTAAQRLIDKIKEYSILFSWVPRIKLDQMTGNANHQGIVAQVGEYRYFEVDQIFERANARGEEPFMLVLDKLTDPQNLGSILRTAECAGLHGVIIPKRRAVGVTSVVSRVSAGATEHMAVARVTNLVQTLKELKERGVWIIGLDMDGTQIYDQLDLTIPAAIVIGSEGEGLSRLVKEQCDFLVQIPLRGRIKSLNAAVAASLVMYHGELCRRSPGK